MRISWAADATLERDDSAKPTADPLIKLLPDLQGTQSDRLLDRV